MESRLFRVRRGNARSYGVLETRNNVLLRALSIVVIPGDPNPSKDRSNYMIGVMERSEKRGT